MTLEITESEMLYRYVDGLKESASAAFKLGSPITADKPKALSEFIHGMKVAAGSAHQLGIYRENLKMLHIRDLLEQVLAEAEQVLITPASTPKYWHQIKSSLETMIKIGQQIAESKPVSRVEVLKQLETKLKPTE